MNFDMIMLNQSIKAKLCCMDTYSFIVCIRNKDFYKDIANDVEKWFDISNYGKDDKRPLPKRENKKVVVFLKMNQEERL